MLLLIQQRVCTNRHEPRVCCAFPGVIHIDLGTLWHKEWTWWVHLIKSSRQAVYFYSEQQSRCSASLILSLSLFSTVASITPLWAQTLTTISWWQRLKTSLGPGNHGNALRRQAGQRPIGFGLWLGGWDHVVLALTTSPQGHFRGLAPRTPRCHAPLLQTTTSGKVKVSLPAFRRGWHLYRWEEQDYKSNVNTSSEYNHTRLVCSCFFFSNCKVIIHPVHFV